LIQATVRGAVGFNSLALTACAIGHYNAFRSSRLLFFRAFDCFRPEESIVSLVKIIVITIALILTILLFGRFLF
jgi:hypothetical protein